MPVPRLRVAAQPVAGETRWRFRYTLVTVIVAVVLISWGGLVTSIDAGLAVPDWPTSFGSYDPFATGFEDPMDPTARWWNRLPILAEHGHRLLGALVGLLTLGLAFWTWRADPRRWMRLLGFAALGLVIVQGLLGGLRVIWISLDLAVVHACVAQLFFSLLVAMALFTSPGWLRADSVVPSSTEAQRLSRLSLATVGVLYLQIILGALLRHPGLGIDLLFVSIHIAGAFAVVGMVLATFIQVRKAFPGNRLLNRAVWSMFGAVALQFMLGFLAFLVLIYDAQATQRSVLQVALTSAHLVVGALLMASSVSLTLLALRRPHATATSARPAVPTTASMSPIGS